MCIYFLLQWHVFKSDLIIENLTLKSHESDNIRSGHCVLCIPTILCIATMVTTAMYKNGYQNKLWACDILKQSYSYSLIT